jgi:acetylornithine deacetylase/succinyl-diaminopimelate desuccinylase-like protein
MKLLTELDQNFEKHLELLRDFVAIASVSTDPEYKPEVIRACQWVKERCEEAGLRTEIRETEGHPAVVAHNTYREGLPHILIYGHYDVQPAQKSDGWKTEPFEPTLEDGYLYGRGVSDNKGQILAHLCALKGLSQSEEGIPVNVTVLVEGEEEIGSPNLPNLLQVLANERPPLDLAIVSDTSTAVKGRPMIQYSLRGIVISEVFLTTAQREIHSGIFGGTTENAIRSLTRLLSKLFDDNNLVTIPGWYDRVAEPQDWERRELEKLPFDEEPYLEWIGASAAIGEAGFTTNQRRWFRPTLEFNGITGGYQGKGSKTIVPHKASVKLSARLVPDQDPDEVEDMMEKWFLDNCPAGAKIEYVRGHAGPPYIMGQTEKERKLLATAKSVLKEAFEAEPLLSRHGGAIPIVTPFQTILGVKTLLMGLGFPDDGVHSYDERFHTEQFRKGIRMSALALHRFAESLAP